MSKGGSETQTTEIPDWLKGPAIRNLQRAEDVQRIPYMPYRGPDVAGFNPTQQAAMGTNIDTARAFGLLGDNYLNLTPLSGMPEPTEFAGGWSGYSSMPLYDQALEETKAKQPEAWEQYQALYGANVPTQRDTPVSNGGGGGGAGGGANDGWAGGNVMGHTAYASAGDAMAAGDYWSAYRQDHQQWRDNQGIYAGGKGKQPGQSDTDYPGNPTLGIRSDQNQLEAMGMGGDNTTITQTSPGSGTSDQISYQYGEGDMSGLGAPNTNVVSTADQGIPWLQETTIPSNDQISYQYGEGDMSGLGSTTFGALSDQELKKKMI